MQRLPGPTLVLAGLACPCGAAGGVSIEWPGDFTVFTSIWSLALSGDDPCHEAHGDHDEDRSP